MKEKKSSPGIYRGISLFSFASSKEGESKKLRRFFIILARGILILLVCDEITAEMQIFNKIGYNKN